MATTTGPIRTSPVDQNIKLDLLTTTFWFLNLHSTLPTLPTVSRENLSDQSDSSSRSAACI